MYSDTFILDIDQTDHGFEIVGRFTGEEGVEFAFNVEQLDETFAGVLGKTIVTVVAADSARTELGDA